LPKIAARSFFVIPIYSAVIATELHPTTNEIAKRRKDSGINLLIKMTGIIEIIVTLKIGTNTFLMYIEHDNPTMS
jgi:hypothetical protein